ALSPRERATLALLTEGLSNAEIAARLAISEKTVRNHLSNLFDKLGVWSRAQAIVFAREHGFTGAACFRPSPCTPDRRCPSVRLPHHRQILAAGAPSSGFEGGGFWCALLPGAAPFGL